MAPPQIVYGTLKHGIEERGGECPGIVDSDDAGAVGHSTGQLLVGGSSLRRNDELIEVIQTSPSHLGCDGPRERRTTNVVGGGQHHGGVLRDCCDGLDGRLP